MSRRVGQIIALLSVLSLIVVVVVYQIYTQDRLRTDVLNSGYGVVTPCGNNVMDAGENCDDGNTVSGDGCSDQCVSEKLPFCGDSMVEGSEQCDDGNAVSNDGCSDTCQTEPVCGNGTLEGVEQCDDNNLVAGDGCDVACQLELPPVVCGNGSLEAGEQCDDGNVLPGDGCSDLCVIEPAPGVCGDGAVDAGEQCDDSNVVAGDGCDSTCQNEPLVPVCGNNTLEPLEECDDGNVLSGDGCSDACRTEQTVTTTSTPSSPLDPNVPQSSSSENGLLVNRYLAVFSEKAILDGLQVSQHVPSFATEVYWSEESGNPSQITIDDADAARTFFMAPSQEGDYGFMLSVKQGGTFVPVARYVFTIVSPLVFSADANKDGKYDFNDLLNLLQNWQTYGNQATQILSVILSRYQVQ